VRQRCDQPSQFDFYDGGGLDVSCLGAAEIDEQGNVNVSRYSPKLPGCGGFIDISQNAKQLLFLGTMTAGAELAVEKGDLRILKEGRFRKFVAGVQQRTFSAEIAVRRRQPVLYITERCVFRLTPGGIELIEVARGLDPERDVLSQMDFRPLVAEQLGEMYPRCFAEGLMGVAQEERWRQG